MASGIQGSATLVRNMVRNCLGSEIGVESTTKAPLVFLRDSFGSKSDPGRGAIAVGGGGGRRAEFHVVERKGTRPASAIVRIKCADLEFPVK